MLVITVELQDPSWLGPTGWCLIAITLASVAGLRAAAAFALTRQGLRGAR
ncbi:MULTISPECIES: hypothetical protein [Streptomyces]|nr:MULTISPECIES: hypothetical protein [Streptomyces]QRV55623.1 hypothetical protein I6J40_16460 [Streptomyces californicus]